MYTLEGVSSVANFITAYEESQYIRGSHFLSVIFSLFPKAIVFTLILPHRSWCWCPVATVIRIFEVRVLLMYALEGVSSVANFITAYKVPQTQ